MTTGDKFPPESDTTRLGRISAETRKADVPVSSFVAWLKRLDFQHLVLFLTFLVTGVMPQVVSLETDLGMPSWVTPTSKVLAGLTFLLGLFKQYSAPGTPFGMKRTVLSSGTVRASLLMFAVSITTLLLACSSCGASGPHVTPPVTTPIDGGFQVCTIISAELRDGGAMAFPNSVGVNVHIVDGGLEVCTQVQADLKE